MEVAWSTAEAATGNLAGGISLRGFGGWELHTTSIASPTAVPEPGSLALIASGLAGPGVRRRLKL